MRFFAGVALGQRVLAIAADLVQVSVFGDGLNAAVDAAQDARRLVEWQAGQAAFVRGEGRQPR